MSELAYVKLSDDDVAQRLKGLDGWRVEGGLLKKEFAFKTYKDGVVFASAVGFIADKLDHHPDIALGYAKIGIAVNTHSVDGISPYDFELARRIDGL